MREDFAAGRGIGKPWAGTSTSAPRLDPALRRWLVEWYDDDIRTLERMFERQEPVQTDDEDKRGGVRDAGGTTWIATRVG